VRVKFQADADLNLVNVFSLLRQEPTIDFQTALAANFASRHDLDVLAISATERRVLVTHDQKTMPDHFAEFVAHQESTGVIIVPQHLPVSAVVDELLLIWGASEAEEWINRISYLPL
jgi:hypothetical protein